MTVRIREDSAALLQGVGIKGAYQIASHLGEIEQEADVILDRLTAIRAFAYQGDAGAVQESLTELTVALRHLTHHAEVVLPLLEEQLGIADEETDLD